MLTIPTKSEFEYGEGYAATPLYSPGVCGVSAYQSSKQNYIVLYILLLYLVTIETLSY